MLDLRIIPRMSEKSYAQSQKGTYVFDVPTTANKQQIGEAVTAQYKVTVESITTIVVKGKVKSSYRKRGAAVKGKRTDIKKAYVRLAEGQSIPVFAAAEAAEEKK